MTSAAPHDESNPVSGALRAGFVAVAGLMVIAAFALTALAAAAIGLLIAVAAIALRAMPRRSEPSILKGRRAAHGWVVEVR